MAENPNNANGAKTVKSKGSAPKKTASKSAKSKKNKLVIVESPAKAKTIGKFLGTGYKVIASNGHVRDLPKSQLGVDVEANFEPRYITLRGRGEVLEKIRKEAKGADRIFLATDPDREGEAISWHLAQVLKMDTASDCRIVFNEITPAAIKGAIKQPRAIDMHLVDAQQARRILDRLVGYKISPILWGKVRKGLSAGRVQSVATRIIVDREAEIRDFVPVEFWTIVSKLAESGGKKTFDARFYGKAGQKIDLNDESETMQVVNAVQDKPYTATEVKRGERKKSPAAPFTTSNLQQEASRKLGFTTKRCMLVAQQLYEGIDINGKGAVGLVTYIRTDSVRTADEAIEAVRAAITERFGPAYVPDKHNVFKGRKNAQDAHEAIRPTYIDKTPESLKGKLTNDQFKLYKLIYERFVASQMKNALYETMSVSFDAAGYEFRASGSRVLFDGYTKIYEEGRDAKPDEAESRDGKEAKETMLPDIAVGDVFQAKEVLPEQHFTQPPPRFTEASLVKALEEKGIGRPSTYSPTISTIIDRGYVCRDKRVLIPTELGEIVTTIMKGNFSNIVDEHFTAQMEEDLDDIEVGKESWRSVLGAFYVPFEKELAVAEENIEKVQIADEVSDIPCEKCGAMLVYKFGRFGRFLACPNYPECKNTKPIVDPIDAPCPKCGAKLLRRKSKKGHRTFFGCERYPDCDFVSWDEPTKEPCPKCGSMMVFKGGKAGREMRCTNAECKHVIPVPAPNETNEVNHA